MFFRQLLHEDRSCLSYMVGCNTEGTVAVIDPQQNISVYQEIAKQHGLSIDYVIDTHVQADHESGARKLAGATAAEWLMSVSTPVEGITRGLNNEEAFKVGNRTFKVIATPGHTADGITLYVDDWYLLTGDTLFVGDVGRVDLTLQEPDQAELRENAGNLYDSVQKLLRLPEWTELYPGNFAGSSCGKGLSAKMISTIGRERRKNEVLKKSRNDFIEYVTTGTPDPPPDYREIKQQNITGA